MGYLYNRKKSCHTPFHVLFLTSNLGNGHKRAAQAIGTVLQRRDPGIRLSYVDFWNLMDYKVAGAVKRIYLQFVSENPHYYDYIYGLDRNILMEQITRGNIFKPLNTMVRDFSMRSAACAEDANRRQHLLDRLFLRLILSSLGGNGYSESCRILRWHMLRWLPVLLAERLKFIIQDHNPDIVVATQMFPAALLTALKRRKKLDHHIICVLTDYGFHDLWVQPDTDHYCAPTRELAERLCDRGIPDSRVHDTGIPVMPGFSRTTSCAQARLNLGLEPGLKTVLVSGGGLGIGISDVMKDLTSRHHSWQIVVATGEKNGALKGYVDNQPSKSDVNVRFFGWTEQMDDIIRAADVVVAKPGGLTVAESLACGKPLLAPFSLGGQEGFNVRFLTRHGVGGLIQKGRLAESLDELMEDSEKLTDIQNRSWRLGCRDSADRIADLVEQIAEES